VSKRPGCVWCGIDGGKGHHWAAVVDETGATVWSKKIDNDESAILAALGEILDLADEVRWAVDISGTLSRSETHRCWSSRVSVLVDDAAQYSGAEESVRGQVGRGRRVLLGGGGSCPRAWWGRWPL
jgi:hypothetical protein